MKQNKLIFPVILFISSFLIPGIIFGQYTIQNCVFGNGSTVITDSTEFTLYGTVAPPPSGQPGNEYYSVSTGFWFQTVYYYTDLNNSFSITVPLNFVLFQNYPNPFNPTTTIKYGLPKTSDVKIELYNLLGQKVSCLFNGKKSAGYYQIMYNASHLASGIYLYAIQAENFYKVKKMVLLK